MGTVGTKIVMDPEKGVQELASENLLILLRDRPLLEVIIISSTLHQEGKNSLKIKFLGRIFLGHPLG